MILSKGTVQISFPRPSSARTSDRAVKGSTGTCFRQFSSDYGTELSATHHCSQDTPIVPTPGATAAWNTGDYSQYESQECEAACNHPAIRHEFGVIPDG